MEILFPKSLKFWRRLCRIIIMLGLLKLSLQSFYHKKILVILLIQCLAGTTINFYHRDSHFLIIAANNFLITLIFTVILLLKIDNRKIDLPSLIRLKKELLNSFLLLATCPLLLLIIGGITDQPPEQDNYINSSFDTILLMALVSLVTIVSIDFGVAINYTLLDKKGIKDSLIYSISIIKEYRIMLLLSIISIQSFFGVVIPALVYFITDINLISEYKIKSINYICFEQITNSLLHFYRISFFYYFWKKRKDDLHTLSVKSSI